MKPIGREGKRLNIAFVLAKHFTLTPFALFADVLRLAGDDGDRSRRVNFDWHILGDRGLPIEASCGAAVLPTRSYDSSTVYDAVVIVGGLLAGVLQITPSMERFILAAAKRETPLIGLCTGSFILAELGLLESCRASVSWFHIHEFRERYPNVAASAETLYVLGQRISTCSGGSGAADLAAEFVRRHLDDEPVENAARILLIDQLRNDKAPQPKLSYFDRARDSVVKRTLLFMDSNIAAVHSVTAVAAHVGCTSRQLQRRFLADLGLTPSQAYMNIRIQVARRLLSQTDMAVSDVGYAVGFANPSHFSRSFRRLLGSAPTSFRSGTA